MNFVMALMKGSFVHAKAAKAKAKAQAATRLRTSADCSAQLVLRHTSNEDMNYELVDGTPKLWLRELAQRLLNSGQTIREVGGEGPRVGILSQSLRCAAGLVLKFCFAGEVAMNVKALNERPAARAAIRPIIVNDQLS